MLDFTLVRNHEVTLSELTALLSPEDLRRLTNEMIDTILMLLIDCTDEDVVFVPRDQEAYDPYAQNEAETDLPWTLGHVIVHVTASAEESAALAAELARGVAYRGGRSRSEVPWETITRIEQCRQRLLESRRMRLASLDMWPDTPDLENSYRPKPYSDAMNAVERFVRGLMHDDDHLEQIAEIIRQAKAVQVG